MNSCRRAWEVEARRDGHLSAEARERFERHLAGCAGCQAEDAALASLSHALRERVFAAPDELALRRRKQDLIAMAHAERVMETPPVPNKRFTHVLVTSAAAMGLLVSGLWLQVDFRHRQDAEATSDSVVLTADGGARFARRRADGRDLVLLQEGRLKVHVKRTINDPVVVVMTPDGEIEDVGTVFSVVVSGGRTTSIEVTEGRVVARLTGQPERIVEATQTLRPYEPWVPDASTTNLATPSASALQAESESVEAPRKVAPPRRMRRLRSSAESSPAVSAGAEDFALAVAFLERGDNAEAADAFAHFVERYATDPLAEDASYLRVVALLRSEKRREAKAAARAYLESFPRGFRVREARRVLVAEPATE